MVQFLICNACQGTNFSVSGLMVSLGAQETAQAMRWFSSSLVPPTAIKGTVSALVLVCN